MGTAAKLALPRVVEIMGDTFGGDAKRREAERLKAEELLNKDFAGPVPNKTGALLRTAATTDVKEVFDELDTAHQGVLKRDGIGAAAQKLGFPLSEGDLDKAMAELDNNGDGEISFPEFLAWWNSDSESISLRNRMKERIVPH